MGVKVRQWKGAWWLDVIHQGKRKRTRVGTGPEGKKAAQIAATKLQARLALGENLADEPVVPTFADAAEKWLTAYSKLGQLRASTVALYSHNLRTYAVPRFG